MNEPPFFTGIESLTPGFLSAALREAGVIDDEQVVRCHRVLLAKQGATSTIYRMWLGYDGSAPRAPRTLIAKVASHNGATRDLMNGLGAYERELRFYAELAENTDLNTPRCFYAARAPERGTFLLLLEDLPGDPGIDSLDALEQALCDLARMHARHWCTAELGALGWLEHTAEQDVLLTRLLSEAAERIRSRMGDALPPTFARVLEVAGGQLECFAVRERRRAFTLVHGDLQPRNVLRAARGLTFIDWQCVTVGSPGRDLARLIAMSLPPMPRQGQERRLVAIYHGALREHGVQGYSLRDCFQDYRFGLMTSALLNAVALSALDEHTLFTPSLEDGPTPMDLLVHRIDAALDANTLLPILHAELFLGRAA
jgi:hypothetical protein